MNRRPSLLFVAPILPALTGNGLAMRAGMFLDALARDFLVTLLIVPVAAGSTSCRFSRFVAARTRCVVVPSLDGKLDSLWELCSRVVDPAARGAALAAYPRPAMCRYATTRYINDVQTLLAGARFEVVHVMRSYLAPYAAPLVSGKFTSSSPFTSLDLDDDEAATHRGLAALIERLGPAHEARIEAAEASKYERLESEWLPRFRRLITCTTEHAQRIGIDFPGSRVATVPNTIRLPPRTLRRPGAGKRILFVGNLSYLPNADGIRGFALDVLPRLRARLGGEVTLRIAGSAPGPDINALETLSGVELVANPVDLAKHYAWANLAVIPLETGGGTRIKLLEAFAHGVPVVATQVGASGIAVEHRTHLLLADSPATLADACAALLSDAQLSARLSANARRLVEARYAHASGVQIIRDEFKNVSLPQATR